jgi:hypothetical protein
MALVIGKNSMHQPENKVYLNAPSLSEKKA